MKVKKYVYEKYGLNFRAYLNHVRIEKAAEFLEKTGVISKAEGLVYVCNIDIF